MTDRRARGWCFTINNYDQSAIDALDNLESHYCIYGKEVAPGTGTPHLQGYVYFRSARGFKSVRDVLPAGAHLEIARGSGPQNRDYCSKGGDFREFGTCPLDPSEKGDRERARWRRIVDLAEMGDFGTLRDEYPDVYARQLRMLEHIHRKRPRTVDSLEGSGPFHEWIVGPTGCGKSSQARRENPGAYIKEPESRWWDDYDGEESAIIDDFDKFQLALGGNLKRWLDRYPFQAEVKGGMMMIRPKKIVVTSQYRPDQIWDDEKTVDAIMRRVKLIEYPSVPEPAIVASFNKPN